MNAQSQSSSTRVDEIVDGIFRISTPVPASVVPGGFTFNRYSIRDDEPLLFHTGPRMLFAAVREAIGRVLPVTGLRYVAFSHVEADECGSLNPFLASAPQAVPLCGQIAAMVSIGDLFTQFGEQHPAITESDILEPSEAARIGMDYYAHSPATGRTLERLADTAPTTLACMHGPAWRGDGAALLRSLASRLASARPPA